jgi:hypothetical protein
MTQSTLNTSLNGQSENDLRASATLIADLLIDFVESNQLAISNEPEPMDGLPSSVLENAGTETPSSGAIETQPLTVEETSTACKASAGSTPQGPRPCGKKAQISSQQLTMEL